MNALYPLSSAIIMDDDIFERYGGDSLLGTEEQREAVYHIAEEAVSKDLSTLLLPVTVTGTYTWSEYSPFILTEWAYINSIDLIRFIDTKEYIYYSVSGTDNIYVSINDMNYGKVDVHRIFGNCQCASAARPYPYQIQVIYNAGLPTGTATQPNMLLALTAYSKLVLNEIIGYGNESPGLVGVQEFRNQGYSELRTKLRQTRFGSSTQAQFIFDLLSDYKLYRNVKLGW